MAPAPVMAGEVKTERVSFRPGTSGATVAGKIQGRTSRHYLAGAKTGQNMPVRLEADNGAAYFNTFAPGDAPGEAEAMHIGSTGGNEYAGTLPETGDYLIQVYLYRSAARRNETARVELNISIDADGGAIMNVSKNADPITITVGDQRFEFPEAAINGG